MQEEETFQIPLKDIDVTRAACTNLDVLQENVLMTIGMWMRILERIHKVHSTGRDLQKFKQLPNLIFVAAQKKEKQEWANEKPKLDNARILRVISFINLEDGECKETARRTCLMYTAVNGYNSVNHCKLVDKFSDASSDENFGCEGSSG